MEQKRTKNVGFQCETVSQKRESQVLEHTFFHNNIYTEEQKPRYMFNSNAQTTINAL